jgi:hypothetical protein
MFQKDLDPYVTDVFLECGHWVKATEFKDCAKYGTCTKDWCQKKLNPSAKYCIELYAISFLQRKKQ